MCKCVLLIEMQLFSKYLCEKLQLGFSQNHAALTHTLAHTKFNSFSPSKVRSPIQTMYCDLNYLLYPAYSFI